MAFPQREPLGDAAVLLRLGDCAEDALNARVQALAGAIRALGHPAIRDVVPSFAAVAVYLDPLPAEGWRALEAELDRLMGADLRAGTVEPRVVEVPVQYGGEAGPDLEDVARHAGLSPDEVVRRHAGGLYRVHFLGFSPGFPYLGGLDPALATPRRATPRPLVPAGSVGIGGAQTGVYPQASPGGWNLIGRTALPLFDPMASEPCLLRAGDLVRFVEVP